MKIKRDSVHLNNIDIVMTATIRPEVINLTLKSFCNKFLNQFKKVRLIINIDPIGDERYNSKDVLDVCYKYIDDIVYNTPNEPSFPKAVKWCWEQVQSEYFLHLEDDWLLKKYINKDVLFNIFQDDKINCVRFFLSKNNKLKSQNSYIYSNGLSLNPTIFRKRFLDDILLPNFDTTKDPEKQFNHLESVKYGMLVFGNSKDGRYTIDIGKKWRKLKQFNKPNITLSSTKSWDKIDNNFSLRNYLNYKFYMFYWSIVAKV